jgi:myosin heavy subunit
MACTPKSISPEMRKPLHSQVTSLREERVTLLESQRALREERDTLTKQLRKASERISELQTKVAEGDASKAQIVEEMAETRRSSQLTEALASQLRIEASQWQARLEQGEAERARKASEDEVERRRTAELAESDRFRLLGDLAELQAVHKASEENWRRLQAEAAATRGMLERQRDDAIARLARAEEALAAALGENTALGEALARTTHDARETRSLLEIKADTAEKRWAETARRCEELGRLKQESEQHRVASDEALTAALHDKRFIESQLNEERLSNQSSVKREGGLRGQLEAAEWALATSSQQAAALEAERAADAARPHTLPRRRQRRRRRHAFRRVQSQSRRLPSRSE